MPERLSKKGIFGVVYGFASVGWLTDHGPLLGTLVTDVTRWRWIFYINLPVGVIALVGLLLFLPTNVSLRSTRYSGWAAVRRIDFMGAVLAAAATICLLLGLTWGSDQTYAWSSPQVIGILVAAGVLFVLFSPYDDPRSPLMERGHWKGPSEPGKSAPDEGHLMTFSRVWKTKRVLVTKKDRTFPSERVMLIEPTCSPSVSINLQLTNPS